MGVHLLALIISALAASAAFTLAMAAGLATRGRPEEVVPTNAPDWEDRLAPYLAIVPVPQSLIQRWGAPFVQQELVHAGVAWEGRWFAAFRWACLWLAALTAAAIGYSQRWSLLGQFMALLILLTAYLWPSVWLGWRRQRRCETIDRTLPDFLDRLTLSMEAGLGFEIALRRTATNFPGLLGDELRRLIRSIDRGHARTDALDQFVTRTPSSDLAAFVTAVKQSDRLGTSLARTLRVQSQILRTRRRRRAEEAGRRLPVLIVFPLVFFFLPALLIIYLAPPMLHLFLGR